MGIWVAIALIVVSLPLSLAARRQVMRDDTDRNPTSIKMPHGTLFPKSRKMIS